MPALVLAAGRSSRMGQPKAMLPIGGDTFLSRIVRTFLIAGVDDIVIVLGHDADAIAASFASSGLAARFALNQQYDRGQLSSLRTGLAVVDRPGVAGVLVTLVDVPLVSPDTVRAVLDRYRLRHPHVVRPVNGSRHGHPFLLDRALFDELRTASDDSGAKPIVRAHVTSEGEVEVEDEGAFIDIDTMEEYERLKSNVESRK